MRDLLKKMTMPFKVARLWNAALDRSADRKYTEALFCLQSIYDEMGVEMPSPNMDYEFNLLLAHVYEKLNDCTKAIEAARITVDQIEASNRLSKAEKNYLLYYCKILLEYCATELGVDPLRQAPQIGVSISDLEFDRVPSHLRSKFPVITSPPP